MKHKTLAGISVMIIGMLLFPLNVLAADKEIKVRSVEISANTATVRVNQIRTLFAYVMPLDADEQEIFWATSDEEIVMVDYEGILTGVSPGIAIVTATSADGKKSASCTVTVPGTVARSPSLVLEIDNQSHPYAGMDGGELLPAATLRADVEKAVKESSNKTARLTYRDKTEVTAAALRSADYAARAARGSVLLQFDTTFSDGGVGGRLTVDPSLAKSLEDDIRLEVFTSTEKTQAVWDALEKKSMNPAVVISCGQTGSYGMKVQIAAKLGVTGLDADSLSLYSYNSATGAMTLLENANVWTDQKDYLHFETDHGGMYIAVSVNR